MSGLVADHLQLTGGEKHPGPHLFKASNETSAKNSGIRTDTNEKLIIGRSNRTEEEQ